MCVCLFAYKGNSSLMIQAPDVALSTCEVTLKPKSCSRRDCGRQVVKVVAVSDFIDDQNRRTRIITETAQTHSLLWKSHNPPDVVVSSFPPPVSFGTLSESEKDLKMIIKFLVKLIGDHFCFVSDVYETNYMNC